MDAVEWEREYAAQNAYLAKQLRALSARPYKARRQYIDHEIRCSCCGDVLIEIVRLDPYRVIRYRGIEPDQQELHKSSPSTWIRRRARVTAQRQRSIRLDKDWMFFPIADDEQGERNLVDATCRCTRRHRFTVQGILGRSGAKSTSNPPRPR